VKVLRRIVSPYQTNCYLLIDEATNDAALIDPGDNSAMLCQWIKEQSVNLRYIFITHGHIDHVGAAPEVDNAFPTAAVYIHKVDAEGTGMYSFPLAQKIDSLHYYDEGDTLPLGELTIKVLHTPGHTEGGVTLLIGDAMFCGDTLFAGSMGRTDLPGGNEEKIFASLARLGALDGDCRVFPGHMEDTMLSYERKHNMYLKFAMNKKESE